MTRSDSPEVTLLLAADTDDRPTRDSVAVTLASLQAQTRDDWELVLTGVAVAYGFHDPRVRAVEGGNAVAGEDAVSRAVAGARGRWIGFVDAGDTLSDRALEFLSDDLAAFPEAVAVYTDEDYPPLAPDPKPVTAEPVTDDRPAARRPVYKPDWSPERERHGDVLGRLCLLRTEVVEAAGGWLPDAGPAAEYDLILRVTERGGRVVHVPEILYHRAAVPAAASSEHDKAARAAARRHLDRIGLRASVEPGPAPGAHRIRRTLDPAVRVSVVIPTRWTVAEIQGRSQCLPVEAVRTMMSRTAHDALQFVVVYDEPVPAGALEELAQLAGDRLTVVPYRKPFNFSEKCNLGFLHATGDVIVLANDDLQPVSDHWVESLVAPALEADVGLVGTKLVHEDGTIQHGGHVHVRDPHAARPSLAYRGATADTIGEQHSLVVNRETTGVTGACVAFRRTVYEQVGGLTEDLPVNFNDVDLSLKVLRLGLRILWLAEPVLYHFESRSREPVVEDYERRFMYDRWGGFAGDAYLPWLMPPVSRVRF